MSRQYLLQSRNLQLQTQKSQQRLPPSHMIMSLRWGNIFSWEWTQRN